MKVAAMTRYGIQVKERVAVLVRPTDANRSYLKAKQFKMGHYLGLSEGDHL